MARRKRHALQKRTRPSIVRWIPFVYYYENGQRKTYWRPAKEVFEDREPRERDRSLRGKDRIRARRAA